MPQPGWYADPDGTPERLRWWDGTRWTEHLHGPDVPPSPDRRRGPWPWVGLGVAGALVIGVVVGFGFGLFGEGGPWASPVTEASASPTSTSASPTTRPTMPTSSPSVSAATAQDGCAAIATGTLSDGQIVLDIPASWQRGEAVSWLTCGQSAMASQSGAGVTVGVSAFHDVREAAEEYWSATLLNAAAPHAITQTGSPVTASGREGWMISGTVPVDDQFLDLSVIVLDVGEQPSVVVTVADATDRSAQASISAVLQSLRLVKR